MSKLAPGRRLRRLLAAAACLAMSVPSCVMGQAAEGLRAHHAAISESSISGVSSGGFMPVQFATAWSSIVKGVGVIAGGPYFCAVTQTQSDALKP
jgi:hypothetical protein